MNYKDFKEKFIEEKQYTRIGSWWDRRGENEIDLVCEDELSGRLDFYEVKREKSRLNLNVLKAKAEAFLAKNPQLKRHRTTFKGLTMQDM